MHKCEWAGVNGRMTTGRRPYLLTSFQDCLELHKLTVFTADKAKRHWYRIQQVVCKPQRATVGHHVACVGVLYDNVEYLLTLKDSPKAVPMMKKGNIPFSKTDLAAIVLASVPMMWQNQYNLTHLTVPKSMRALVSVLENIEQVVVERQNKRLKAKVRQLKPVLTPRVIPREKLLGLE